MNNTSKGIKKRYTSNSKKKKRIDTEREYELNIEFSEDSFSYITKLFDGNIEVGEFTIGKNKPHDLNIHIDDAYKSKGYSKKLISKMCEEVTSKISPEEMLYIDSDASWEKNKYGELKSYWENLGMKETPTDDEYYGYEKQIKLKDLCKKVSGGGKSRKSRKSRKSHKLRKSRKSRKSRKNKKGGGPGCAPCAGSLA